MIALHLDEAPTAADLAAAAELWQADEEARTAGTAPPRLLTVPQVREVLGCGKNLVYELIASGRLPALDVSARPGSRPSFRVREKDLEALRYSPPLIPTELEAPSPRRRVAGQSRLRVIERELRAAG